MKALEKLQTLLPVGYLFLIVMGILKETIFYYQLGINILKYSTLIDILISPIADLAAHPIMLLFVVVIFFSPFLFTTYLAKKSDKPWVQKISGVKAVDGQSTADEVKSNFIKISSIFLTIGLLSFFLGLGIGQGKMVARKIEANELKYDTKINLNSGESEQIYLIGSNSVYYFYITKGEQFIKIVPVGNIKNIELLNNKMLKFPILK